MKKQEYLDFLRIKHLKITPKRSAVIDIFLKDKKFYTPSEIWSFLKNDFDQMGLPTVYRILQQFQEIGLAANLR